MVHLEIGASDGHELFMTLLRLDTGFAMMPRAFSHSAGTPTSFEAQNQKPSASGFEAQTIKSPREAYPLHLLHHLDTRHRHPQRPITKSSSVCLTWSTIPLS